MKNSFKKFVAVVLSATMALSMSTVAFAAQTGEVFCNFICAGQITGKTVPAGSNVVAPSVPVVGGFTFCGFDKSLKNITSNTTFTAVYVSDALGKEAIEAKKASLPTPAISATTVANPNSAAVVAMPAAQTIAGAAVATPATAQVATGVTQATATADQQALLLLLQQAIMAQANSASATAVTNAAANAATAAAQTVTPAQTAAVANAATQVATAAAPVAQAVVAAVPAGLPSWVVGLEGVDAAGAANAYNYLKNTKGLDDATIQANWGAFMHHYAGHGVAGW